MRIMVFSLLTTALLFICGCATPAKDTLTQYSTIDALLAGLYDGRMSCSQLLEYGNFGLGTFDDLDGEMIVLDGKVYQVKIDGKVYCPAPDTEIPFAAVVSFQPEKKMELSGVKTLSALTDFMNSRTPGNMFCAFRIDGLFNSVKVRSVPAQEKPYKPLAEVVKKQRVFNLKNVRGSIVGFRSPSFVSGINVPGYHLHFISEDRKSGGHVLGLSLKKGTLYIDVCSKFFLILPEGNKDFMNADLSRDRKQELHKVEK